MIVAHCFSCREDFEIKNPDSQAENCPKCGLLEFNPARPKRTRADIMAGLPDDYVSRPYTDTNQWNPWCPNCGEFNPEERERRKKEGSIRWDPRTKAWSGYFETQKEYNDWMDRKGVCNPWRGEINQDKQGWYRKQG